MNGTQASPDLDPDDIELGEALRNAVEHPVGHVDHVEVRERQRMHADEAVDLRERRVGPGEPGVEAERHAGVLQRRIEPHVGIVPDRLVTRRRDGEADDARLAGEFLDALHAGVGIVERQIEQRLLARVLRQNLLDQPAVIGLGERHLGVDLRMHAEREHRGREHDHVVDAHRVHGALGELHLAVQARRGRLALELLVGNASGDVLVKRAVGVQQPGRRAAAIAERMRDVAQHVVVDAVGDLGPERGFIDVGIDIDDQPVLELSGLLRGLGEVVAGIGADAEIFSSSVTRGGRFVDVHASTLNLMTRRRNRKVIMVQLFCPL